MIDIIIPAYNAHRFIQSTLFSIACQTISNLINVYVVNDCSDYDYSKEIYRFKPYINIKELKTPENIGPGGARQYGIDHSNGKYIVFIDADDVFNDGYSVEKLYNCIDKNNLNILTSNFNEESEEGFKEFLYNEVWVHAKIYRRSFLEENNIRFNNSRSNEDTGFNMLISLNEEKGFPHFDDFTYIWLYNCDSITRRNKNEYDYYGMEGYAYNANWAIEEALKRGYKKDKIASKIFSALLCMYYAYIRFKDLDDKNGNMLLVNSKLLKRLYENNKYYLTKKDKTEIVKSFTSESVRRIGEEKILNNDISFYHFLDLVDKA